MKTYQVSENESFVGREYEVNQLAEILSQPGSKIIVVYGRRRHFASRNQIVKHLKLKSGGTLSNELLDLEVCGFIDAYAPYHLPSKGHLVRYCIKDAFMQFFFLFIEPNLKEIAQGNFR